MFSIKPILGSGRRGVLGIRPHRWALPRGEAPKTPSSPASAGASTREMHNHMIDQLHKIVLRECKAISAGKALKHDAQVASTIKNIVKYHERITRCDIDGHMLSWLSERPKRGIK